MDLSKLIREFLSFSLLHGFVNLSKLFYLCTSRPLPNKTRLKFDQDFKACWRFCFEPEVLMESKHSMPWVRCAFGNVCYRPLSSKGWCKWYVILMSGGLTADDSPVWFADQGGRLGLTNTTTALISSLPATLPPIRVSYTTLHSALDCCNVQKMRWLCNY